MVAHDHDSRVLFLSDDSIMLRLITFDGNSLAACAGCLDIKFCSLPAAQGVIVRLL